MAALDRRIWTYSILTGEENDNIIHLQIAPHLSASGQNMGGRQQEEKNE